MFISNFIYSIKSLISIIKQSFYSRDLYKKVIDNWKGYGLKYFLTSLLIINIPVMLIIAMLYNNVHHVINNVVNIEKGNSHLVDHKNNNIKYADYAIDILNQLPEMSIINGELEVNNNIPVAIISTHNPDLSLYFDTSSKPILNTPYLIKFTKRNIIFGDINISLTRDFKVAQDSNIKLSKENILKFLEKFSHVFISSLLTFLSMVSGIILIYFIPKLILNYVISLLFSMNKKLKITPQQIFRMCLISITPAMCLNSLILTLAMAMPKNVISDLLLVYRDIIISMMAVGYTLFALSSKIVKKTDNIC